MAPLFLFLTPRLDSAARTVHKKTRRRRGRDLRRARCKISLAKVTLLRNLAAVNNRASDSSRKSLVQLF